jgi:hypothetical protein
LVSLSFGHAAEFNWTEHGTIDLDVPSNWKLRGTATEDGGYTFIATPRSEAHALLQISMLPVPPALLLTDGDLRLRLHDSLRTYIDQSVEKEFRVRDLTCRQGKGWYAELTDAALVGQPTTKPDEFKVMRSALLQLEPHVVAIATMLFDEPKGAEPGEMLAIVSSLHFDRHNETKPGP